MTTNGHSREPSSPRNEGKEKRRREKSTQRRTIHIPSLAIGKEIQRLYNSTSTQATKRLQVPGPPRQETISVTVGYNPDGGAWAKCWSQGCAQSDILAALGITNSQSIPWTPAPAPRPRPTIQRRLFTACKPRLQASRISHRDTGTPSGSAIAVPTRRRVDPGGIGGATTKRRNPGVNR